MTAAQPKTPVLAWLLMALTCLLAGLAIVEIRREAVALMPPGVVSATADGVVTGEGDGQLAATPDPNPHPAGEETLPLLFEEVPVPASQGPGRLRVARLTMPAGVALPPEAAAGPAVLFVESGTVAVRIDGVVSVDLGLEAAQVDTALNPGDRLVVAASAHYAIRNGGQVPAVALVVTILPVETVPPMRGPQGPPQGRST